MKGAQNNAPRAMPYRIAILAASHPLAFKGLAMGYSGIFSFFVAEVITGREVFAALLGIISAFITAYFATKPSVMRARTEREQQHATEQASNDAERDRIHAREIKIEQQRYTRDIAFEKARSKYFIQVEALSRQSRHNLSGEVGRLQKYIQDLQGILTAQHIEFPAYDFKYYDDLCGNEDRQIAQLSVPDHLTRNDNDIDEEEIS